MGGYSTKSDWHGGPDHGWWGRAPQGRRARRLHDEWKALGATQQAIEDNAIDRAAAADPAADV